MTTTTDAGTEPARLLDPGMNLTLRPMRYPHFYERYRDGIKNNWTVEEVDLHSDLADLAKLTDAERRDIVGGRTSLVVYTEHRPLGELRARILSHGRRAVRIRTETKTTWG